MAEEHHSKVLIIGAGPAGYTAAIYAARANLQPLLVTGMQPGGQLTITTDVENYPGFADIIQGPWLMEQMQNQAEHVGTRIILDQINALDLSRRPFVATGDSGDRYVGQTRHRRDRRAGALARRARRGGVSRLWRVGLRDLRRVLLPRQGGRRRRRRQHRGRGGDLSDQPRAPGHARSTGATSCAPRRFCRTGCSAIRRSTSSGTASSRRSSASPSRPRSPGSGCAMSAPAPSPNAPATASLSRSATRR